MSDSSPETKLAPPNGLAEIRETFGDIRRYIKPDGTLRPEWERHTLATIELPAPLPLGWDLDRRVPRIRCHHLLEFVFREAFRTIHRAGLWGALKTFDGCYNYRPQRGSSSKFSLHCWGAAIDLNASTNQLGTPGDMHPEIVEAFESQGFLWGGRFFSRSDPGHFQFATGY